MAGRPLVLAGTVQPAQERFYATEIEPHIDGEMVRWVGEADLARKQQLFAEAHAFLMRSAPPTAPEQSAQTGNVPRRGIKDLGREASSRSRLVP
jgi:hypothetical protein